MEKKFDNLNRYEHPLRVCIGNGCFLARGLLEACLRVAHTESGYL